MGGLWLPGALTTRTMRRGRDWGAGGDVFVCVCVCAGGGGGGGGSTSNNLPSHHMYKSPKQFVIAYLGTSELKGSKRP